MLFYVRDLFSSDGPPFVSIEKSIAGFNLLVKFEGRRRGCERGVEANKKSVFVLLSISQFPPPSTEKVRWPRSSFAKQRSR